MVYFKLADTRRRRMGVVHLGTLGVLLIAAWLPTSVAYADGNADTAPAAAGQPDDVVPVRVQVDTRKLLGPNEPFWANMVFHPTEFLDGEWGHDLVALLAETGAVQRYMRLYNQPEDAVVVADDGTISYHWDHFDRRADLLLKHGIKPVVAFFSMPEPIVADPKKSRKRPFLNGKRIYTGVPKDYRLWQTMCADFTRHVLDRYGEPEVTSWYFTCWNEPDLRGFWHSTDTVEYQKVYDFFAAGVKGVNPKIRIGGPSFSSGKTFHNVEPWRVFLKHVASGTNHATGERGTPIDYLSVHTYGGHGGAGGSFSPYPCVDYILAQQRKLVEIRNEFSQLKDVPIIVAEWGVTSGGGKTMAQQPIAEVRNSQYSAAFLTTLVARHLQWRQTDNPNIGDLFLCISGYEIAQKYDFEGKRTVHTLNGFHKPLLCGYKLLAKQCRQLVESRVDGETPTVTAIAARDGDRRVTMLISRFEGEEIKNLAPPIPVELNVAMPWTKLTDATVTHWRIDENHSNAYTIFRKLGSPRKPSPEQIAAIRERMDLETLDKPRRKKIAADYTLRMQLPCNAVSLIEITRGEQSR